MVYKMLKIREIMCEAKIEKAKNNAQFITYRLKSEAVKAAKACGWPIYNVVKIEFRFETCWIVAQTLPEGFINVYAPSGSMLFDARPKKAVKISENSHGHYIFKLNPPLRGYSEVSAKPIDNIWIFNPVNDSNLRFEAEGKTINEALMNLAGYRIDYFT